jgi:hypothetical protein
VRPGNHDRRYHRPRHLGSRRANLRVNEEEGGRGGRGAAEGYRTGVPHDTRHDTTRHDTQTTHKKVSSPCDRNSRAP